MCSSDLTALTFRRNAILGLYCWPWCRTVTLDPGGRRTGTQPEGRGSPRRALRRPRARAGWCGLRRPREAARIRAGQSARRAAGRACSAPAPTCRQGAVSGSAGARGAAGEPRAPGTHVGGSAPEGELGPQHQRPGSENSASRALDPGLGCHQLPAWALANCLRASVSSSHGRKASE